MAKRLHQNKLTYMTLLCEDHFIIHTRISKPRMKPTDVLKFCQSHINKVEKQKKKIRSTFLVLFKYVLLLTVAFMLYTDTPELVHVV